MHTPRQIGGVFCSLLRLLLSDRARFGDLTVGDRAERPHIDAHRVPHHLHRTKRWAGERLLLAVGTGAVDHHLMIHVPKHGVTHPVPGAGEHAVTDLLHWLGSGLANDDQEGEDDMHDAANPHGLNPFVLVESSLKRAFFDSI